MTLRHLRIFVTVCETGSMTAAVSYTHLDVYKRQATISAPMSVPIV